MEHLLKSLHHAKYSLLYHLVFVTKYRKRCINEDIFQTIKVALEHTAQLNGCVIEEISYEPEHVHMLISAPPNIRLSDLVCSMKNISSRRVRRLYAAHLSRYYWKPYFWSRGYYIISSGGAPVEVIKRYIRSQKRDKE